MTTVHRQPSGAEHAEHDRLLVAAHAAGDLGGPELARADALLAACPDCRILRADLVAIAAATRMLPVPVRPARLDFQLTPEQAAKAGADRGWRRLLRPFRTAGWATLKPVATGLTTLGLVGLLVSALPPFPLGAGGAASLSTGGAAAPAPTIGGDDRNAAVGTSTPVAPDAAGEFASQRPAVDTAGSPESPVPSTGAAFEGAAASPVPGPADKDASGRLEAYGEPTSSGPSPLAVASVGLLLVGIGLFVLRRVTLRLG